MERLVSALELLAAARDLDSVMAVVLRASREIAGADGATFILREGDLCFYADEDAIAPLWKGRRFRMDGCVSGWSMSNAQPVVIEDIYLDDRVPAAAYRPTFVKSLVMLPIGRAAPLGAIGNYWGYQRRPPPYEIELLQHLAVATASALENVARFAGLARELKDATHQLELVGREFEALTYSVSHDLRAPLRAIVGFNQALLDDHLDELDADGADCLRRVHTSAHRLGCLVDDLLELSRITCADLTRAPVNLSALAEDIVAELRRGDSTRNVRIFVAPELHVVGDPRLLRRVLAALIGNSWKFTRPRASAEIHLAREHREHREHQGEGDRIVIRDNGVGFDENYSSKLFTPFQRLHASVEFAGNGIGLAIVKRIIARHGGEVFASSRRGEGASFGFTLPH